MDTVLLLSKTRFQFKLITFSFLDLQLYCFFSVANIAISFDYVGQNITGCKSLLLMCWCCLMIYKIGTQNTEFILFDTAVVLGCDTTILYGRHFYISFTTTFRFSTLKVLQILLSLPDYDSWFFFHYFQILGFQEIYNPIIFY